MRATLLQTVGCLVAFLVAGAARAAETIDYSRDIKPILAEYCYACHGPDESKRKAKLRLDLREEAIKEALKPGNAAGSSVIERVTTQDRDEVMPPPHAKKGRLSPAQVDLLRRWIDQGAQFDIHWAFVKPARPAVPAPRQETLTHPIDRFIAAEHEKRGMQLAPEADRATLVRRLSFDLTGLPPTPAEVDAAFNDASAHWYEKVVDRLLASRHYGERQAIHWLDLVRYADTAGYHSDNYRDLYLYRDYVIAAFNNNKRFDQFTIEQLAGDLLPNPTDEQRIASGYNRLLQTTEEGGAQAKEYLAKYAADRVRNVSGVWLASTLGCAECHNHKFDPSTQKDFYSLAAFFADLKEKAVGRQEQTQLPRPEQTAQLQQLDEQMAPLQKLLTTQTPALDAAQQAWEKEAEASKGKGLPKNVQDLLKVEAAKRTPKQQQDLAAHYRTIAPLLEQPRKELTALQQQKDALLKSIPATLVSMTGPARTMRILPRGNWLDDSGEVVTPAVPAFLGVLGKERPTRLELAQWLVSAEQPLTARVFVNRLWKQSFGQGLVKSVDDFGIQGTLPTHPQLLDWLAVEFVESGWDVKRLHKLLLMSHTYRQSSVAKKELRDRDPANLWLARQARYRLDAELVRDNALAISGLLVTKIGGPSVKPYQPAGYWQFLNFPKRDWQADSGENQYRRGLYTFWQRSFLHPSLLAFDAPSREECTADRPRSSTPLQALVLLNDPTYVEAARAFAERLLKEAGPSPTDRLNWAYRQALSRPVQPQEAQVLTALYRKHLEEYSADAQAARQLVSAGQRPVPQDANLAELAAWTSVARVLLNLHETMTRN